MARPASSRRAFFFASFVLIWPLRRRHNVSRGCRGAGRETRMCGCVPLYILLPRFQGCGPGLAGRGDEDRGHWHATRGTSVRRANP